MAFVKDVPDLADYYFAMMRRLAQMCAASQSGRLASPSLLEDMLGKGTGGYCRIGGGAPLLNEKGEIDEMRWKMTKAQLKMAKEFHGKTAPGVTPECLRGEGALERWAAELLDFISFIPEVEAYQFASPHYRALGHPNGNVDNAFFWRTEEGVLEAGLFDFGSCKIGSLGNIVSGSLWAMENDLLAAHERKCVELFASTFLEEGGGPIDVEELHLRLKLSHCGMCAQMPPTLGGAMQCLKKSVWPTVRDMDDLFERCSQVYDPRGGSETYNVAAGMWIVISHLERWERFRVYDAFMQWREREKIPDKTMPW